MLCVTLEIVYDKIFPSGLADEHHTISSRSIQVILKTLRRDVYNLGTPSFPIRRVIQPNPDPLAAARYSYIYWVDHLMDCVAGRDAKHNLQDGGLVEEFLLKKYLNWLKALSLLRGISEGIASILKLTGLLQVSLH